MGGNPVYFNVNSNAASNLVNEFQGPLLVAAGDTGYFVIATQGTSANKGVVLFDNMQLNSGSTVEFGGNQANTSAAIQIGSLTVNGTAGTATLANNAPQNYGVNVTVTNVNGAGNTLNVNHWFTTFNGMVASGVTLGLQNNGGNSYTLASGFSLADSATLTVGAGATANAAGLPGGVLPMGNYSTISGAAPSRRRRGHEQQWHSQRHWRHAGLAGPDCLRHRQPATRHGLGHGRRDHRLRTVRGQRLAGQRGDGQQRRYPERHGQPDERYGQRRRASGSGRPQHRQPHHR